MRLLLIVISIAFLLIILTSSTTIAAECRYGSTQAWFRYSNGTWQNATAHPRLRLGEEFEIKIQIVSKTDLAVIFLKLHEFGTPVYEIINNRTHIDEIINCGRNIKTQQCIMVEWKIRVRPNTTWVNGYGPLEVFVQLNKDDDDCEIICFDVITGYILNDYWNRNSETGNVTIVHSSNQEKFQSNIFPDILIFILLALLRKEHDWNNTYSYITQGRTLKKN